MANSKKAICLRERKKLYGPIVTGLIKESANLGVDIKFYDEDLSEYDYLVIFDNRNVPRLKTKARIGWWMCDLRTPKDLGNLSGRRDAIFLCNTEYAKDYEQTYNAPVYYMPQCGMVGDIIPGRHILWDVSFIGNFNAKWHHNRNEIITEIEKKYELMIISGNKFTRDSAWIYNQSPFNLSVSLDKRGYTSNRTYNILSSGGFCLTLMWPEIELLFENHKHLVWFETPEQAVELIEYYYNNPDKYDIIKEEGKKLYDLKHTPKHRILNMFGILEGKINGFEGYL